MGTTWDTGNMSQLSLALQISPMSQFGPTLQFGPISQLSPMSKMNRQVVTNPGMTVLKHNSNPMTIVW
jgi:hypothetical protein